MYKIFDVHAHYQDRRYREDRDELLMRINKEGVIGIIDSGDSLESSVKCIKTAEKYPFVYAAAGIHPINIKDAKESDIPRISELLKHPKVVAVGEIGLDYYYEDNVSSTIQKQWLGQFIDMAVETGKPIVFHDREAHEDSLEALKNAAAKGIKGVLHCFSGSTEMLREIMKLGFHISVGGVVTFKNARKMVEVIAEVPMDRLLLETDCPYLAPEPYRGQRCDSSMISYVAEKIAEIRRIQPEEVCEITYNNAKKLFGI